MRGSTLSLAILSLGLGGALAAPTPDNSQLEDRQDRISLEPPTSDFLVGSPGNACNQIDASRGFCIINGQLKPSPRDVEERQLIQLPGDEQAQRKEAIKRIQLQIQELERKKYRTPDEEHLLQGLKFALESITGITDQKPPGDGSTILIPGRIKRQLRESPRGPGCLDKLADYFEDVNAFLEQFFDAPSRTTIWSYIVNDALRACMGDTGRLVPDPSKPGSPILPDPTKPGAPLKPDPVHSGAPLKPGKQ